MNANDKAILSVLGIFYFTPMILSIGICICSLISKRFSRDWCDTYKMLLIMFTLSFIPILNVYAYNCVAVMLSFPIRKFFHKLNKPIHKD